MSTEFAERESPRRGRLTAAEERQVERHRAALEERCGREFSLDEAEADWLMNCACEWRQRRQEHMLNMQREEISKYRWLQCEKAQCDIGRQAAVEWVQKHAAAWRKWYEEAYPD